MYKPLKGKGRRISQQGVFFVNGEILMELPEFWLGDLGIVKVKSCEEESWDTKNIKVESSQCKKVIITMTLNVNQFYKLF